MSSKRFSIVYNKGEEKMKMIKYLLLGILLLAGCTTVAEECPVQVCDCSEEVYNVDNFYSNFMKAKLEHADGMMDREKAEKNYAFWSYYYDDGYVLDAVDFCVIARGQYSSSNEHFTKSSAYFLNANKTTEGAYSELIRLYVEKIDIMIDINWAMYEACEYFESAGKFYSKELWDAGDDRLEIGNEKIALHDSLIKGNNEYMAKIDVLEEMLR